MKRKLFVIVALVLVIGFVVTASFTLAKYYQDASVEGVTAMVAKWGFTVEVDTDKLFGDKYDNSGTVTTSNDSLVVKSSDVVVAPGTGGYLTITIDGSALVAAEVAITVGTEFADIYLKTLEDSTYYYPIKWKLSPATGGTVGNATSGSDVASLFSAWNSKKEFKPGEKIENLTYRLEWEWAFDGDNAKDTILGNWANNVKDQVKYEAVTKIVIPTITVSISQINELSD